MIYLKEVRRDTNDVLVSESLYSGERLHRRPGVITVEGRDGAVNLHLGGQADTEGIMFYVMGIDGTTIDSFPAHKWGTRPEEVSPPL
jgi:hypothetical protein